MKGTRLITGFFFFFLGPEIAHLLDPLKGFLKNFAKRRGLIGR